MKKKLEFYNVKTKNKFTTSNYDLISKETRKGIRYFAKAKKGGIDCYRIVSEQFYLLNK